MAHFNLDSYETVQQRIDAFWQQFPEGRISTEVVYRDDKTFVVRASVYENKMEDQMPKATGHAEEVIGSTPVNKTSALENCETSAIGRALRIGGIGKDASREEMEKVQRRSKDPLMTFAELWKYMENMVTVQDWRGAYALAAQNGLINDKLPDSQITVGEYITGKAAALKETP